MATKKLLQEEVFVPEAIVRVLEQAGIDLVFGMPGGNTMLIFDALYSHKSTIRTVLVRHESYAGIMAQVYGRLTGKPGVALGQGAFMLANALLGVIEAHAGSSPMLLLTDLSDNAPFSHHAPYQAGTGEYGNWDAKRSFSGVTKLTIESREGAEAVQNTQLALKHALSGECGPVALLYHSAALTGRVGPRTVPLLYPTQSYLPTLPPQANPASVSAAVRTLREAERPVIIAGGGLRGDEARMELEGLSEWIAAPVVTTASGKGAFPEDHPLAGGVFGTFGLPAANALVSEADLLLVVGSRLAPTDTARENPGLIDPSRQVLIQIDIEPRNAGWTYPIDHVVLGDAAAALAQMRAALRDGGALPAEILEARKDRVEAVRKSHGFFDGPEFHSGEVPLLPQRIIAELRKAIPDDAVIACDGGENRLFMSRFYQHRRPGIFLSPGSTGAMGYALPAALAAKLVHPERACVAVCGDGGFSMTLSALMTACEERIPVVAVVLNNRALGWVKHFQKERVIASELSDQDMAKIARAIGCRGFRVEQPGDLAGALAEALAGDSPAVLDVRTSLRIGYEDIISPLVGAAFMFDR
jgi:acetolactate synthase I/II/III large subunit